MAGQRAAFGEPDRGRTKGQPPVLLAYVESAAKPLLIEIMLANVSTAVARSLRQQDRTGPQHEARANPAGCLRTPIARRGLPVREGWLWPGRAPAGPVAECEGARDRPGHHRGEARGCAEDAGCRTSGTASRAESCKNPPLTARLGFSDRQPSLGPRRDPRGRQSAREKGFSEEDGRAACDHTPQSTPALGPLSA